MKKLIVCAALAACSPAAKQEEAKDAYLEQNMNCVNHFNTREEIDACRAKVRAAWGLDSADAGKDGAK